MVLLSKQIIQKLLIKVLEMNNMISVKSQNAMAEVLWYLKGINE